MVVSAPLVEVFKGILDRHVTGLLQLENHLNSWVVGLHCSRDSMSESSLKDLLAASCVHTAKST